ncbi:putative prolyl aminopeptidase protein [Botrytis fragariae]|uniref:Putative prolyl aminopeptidase protein n=1 Tax=Botrytis fragariae TaxID=1964551 RepID=A0A8H6ECU3_9HELO|nr:putative prolyl aminopeptidase protein [Botrytis fragariae]KAF5867528.1 putative prolyl aminopeptidase protein [Botrytis fragariae]
MSFAILPSKPQASISYKLFEGQNFNLDFPLIVFINGLGLPSVSWAPTIALLQQSTSSVKPNILTYDRYGQGSTTSQDPADNIPGKDPGYGHDMNDAVNDLHELIQVTVLANPKLVLVAASIGVHIARLYAKKHPATVEGLLFLDSNIGNAEATDLWPNPHTPDFKESDMVGDDCTLEQYIQAYARLGRTFNTDVKSPEGLDRRNILQLLPNPSSPKLQGSDGKGPWLKVIGHDPEPFAEEMWMIAKIPKSIDRKYTQPAWQKYNEELLNLTDADRSTDEVLIAPGCGHFIQKDNPQFVATQLEDLLSRI